MLLMGLYLQAVGAAEGGDGGAPASAAAKPVLATKTDKLVGYDPEGGADRRIFQVPIDGTIDLGLAAFVERVVGEATARDIILLQVKTFGGRVDAAVRIRDALLGAAASTVAFVDRRAISAGALITLACKTVFMSPGASIGAATPVQGGAPGAEPQPTSEKVVSYMRAEMRATAEANGRRGDLAEAMVDADIEIAGVTEKGKLLTLTSDRAVELSVADAVAGDLSGVISALNLQDAAVLQRHTHWAEKLARFLTDPVVSSLLMTFGFLGLLMEFYTPGFGVGGVIGLVCLGLFFAGQYTANLAGWEELVVLVLGLVLLALEIFVIPGFGVVGISGLLLVGVGLVMALTEIELPWDVSLELGYVQQAISAASLRIVLVVVALVIGALVFGKVFPGTIMRSWLVLRTSTSAAEGYVSGPSNAPAPIGTRGTTITVLRPAGIADMGGRRVDVVTQGDYIEANTQVEVIQVDGNRVVVKRLG